MATVRLPCPHCSRIERLSIGAPFEVTARSSRRPWLKSVGSPTVTLSVDAVSNLSCQACGGVSIGVFGVSDQGRVFLTSSAGQATGIEGNQNVQPLAVFPSPKQVSAPKEIPVGAREFFVEAKEDLISGRRPAGIISKCRSVLDLCLKELNAEGSGRKAKISNLMTSGILTQSLASWADRLWDDGNEAIHDLTGDEARAAQHVSFLELFFEVAFVLPTQVSLAQADGGGETGQTDVAAVV